MRLKIAVLSRNFSTTGGGAERYAVAVVEELSARHEVHVFTQHIGNELAGVTYHLVALPLRRPRWINQLYFATATWWATRRGFDVVHSHENTWHGQVQAVHVLPVKHNLFAGKQGLALALRWLKVLTSPRLLIYLCLERWRYAPTPKRRVVLTSQALFNDFVAAYPEALAMTEVIPPGVASAPGRCNEAEKQKSRVDLGLPASGRSLLFVGNDFRKKGLPTLLQALATLPDDVWLAVVGQSRQLAEMQRSVQRLGLAHRVWFLGALTDMDTAYRVADCLVHPTLEDTYAMVVLEAMAHGLPVVVSGAPWCGIAGDLRQNIHAVLLNSPTVPSDIQAGVESIFYEPGLAQTLSDHGIEFARQRTWSHVANMHDVVYQHAKT
jgi:UDP-glucose:(heptosyl)LPS alpha-1,3-glucosyltransferase